MFRKAILSAFAVIALLFTAHAPASAAMTLAKPEAAKATTESQVIQVRRGGRGGGFRHGGGRRHGWHKHHRWHGHHHWHHKRYWHWGRYWGSPWAWYRHCKYLQRHGHRIACAKPYYF